MKLFKTPLTDTFNTQALKKDQNSYEINRNFQKVWKPVAATTAKIKWNHMVL